MIAPVHTLHPPDMIRSDNQPDRGGSIVAGAGEDWIALWTTALRRQNRAAATIKRRRMTAYRFEAWCSAHHVRLDQVTDEHIHLWLDSLRHRTTGRAVTPQTRAHYLSDLAAMYHWALKTGRVGVDPCDGIDRPARPHYLPHPIDHSSAAMALALADPTMRLTLALAGLAGLRCAEIAALDVTCIDRAGRTIWVRQGKGARDRVVPICAALDAELARADLPRHGPAVHHQGAAYRANSLSAKVSAYLHSVGIEASLHSWRHWFASTMLDRGVDVRIVQELLGHSSLATTQTYTRVSRAHLGSAVDVLTLPGVDLPASVAR